MINSKKTSIADEPSESLKIEKESRVQSEALSDKFLLKAYRHRIRKKLWFGLGLSLLLIFLFYLSIATGSIKFNIWELKQALLNKSDLSFVLWNIRLPRAVGAVLAGAALGLAGAVMQSLLRNPLASPFTLGVSHGAGFGAALAIIIFGAGQAHSYGAEAVSIFRSYTVAGLAFLGALTAVGLILIIAYLKKVTAESIILAGVALSSLFGSATMFLQYFASDVQVAATVFWMFGDLGKAGWPENRLIFFCFLPAFIYLFSERWNLNALLWGGEVAKSLGVKLERLRLLGLFLSALVVSVVTAFFGIIGFLGLISPHFVRLLVGNDYRFVLPYSVLSGACFLLAADLLARSLLSPVVLPVGIITSLAGVPVFFLLLLRRKRGWHAEA
ncbi:MAG TPA: iron ABC transporter permease [Candidatus Aminicenantes bacterium]|nr:MAG: iron ABC transporter permease [Candidatus Aminicenantes bacterium]HEK85919.1 iron ABC transporter permease [Candidatus Aminicenantes bacterium]